MAYEISEQARARIAAAAQRAAGSLEANPSSQAAIQTLLVKRPTLDEDLDGVRPIIITIIANRGQDMVATISYGTPGRSADDAQSDFRQVVADFLDDDADIEAINGALTEATR